MRLQPIQSTVRSLCTPLLSRHGDTLAKPVDILPTGSQALRDLSNNLPLFFDALNGDVALLVVVWA